MTGNCSAKEKKSIWATFRDKHFGSPIFIAFSCRIKWRSSSKVLYHICMNSYMYKDMDLKATTFFLFWRWTYNYLQHVVPIISFMKYFSKYENTNFYSSNCGRIWSKISIDSQWHRMEAKIHQHHQLVVQILVSGSRSNCMCHNMILINQSWLR